MNTFQQSVDIFWKTLQKKKWFFKNPGLKTLVLGRQWCCKVFKQNANLSIRYKLWNIDSLYNSGWYITIKVWKIYNGKFEVVPFSIKLTIGVKVEVNVKKWGRCNCFCCFFYLQFFFWGIWPESNKKIWIIISQNIKKSLKISKVINQRQYMYSGQKIEQHESH